MSAEKEIELQYFALLREQRGVSHERRTTAAANPRDLYDELRSEFKFSLSPENIRVAVNGDFTGFDHSLKDGDVVAFLPPVAGG